MDARVAPALSDQSTIGWPKSPSKKPGWRSPASQALFGFQLIAVFNERFHQLVQAEQVMHYLALLLVALAIAIIMTPAAYHRLVEQETVTEFFVRLASWLIAGAMVPLMLALALEVYLLGLIVLRSQATSATIAGLGFPLAVRSQRR
jgi:Family of unknown function (DUF6328)